MELTVRVLLPEQPPPAGASAGVDHGPQELPTAQLHRLHLGRRAQRRAQQQRQNPRGTHAGSASPWSPVLVPGRKRSRFIFFFFFFFKLILQIVSGVSFFFLFFPRFSSCYIASTFQLLHDEYLSRFLPLTSPSPSHTHTHTHTHTSLCRDI